MRKIKVVIKRPDEEYGHMTNISDTLENLQKTVGGHIETVTLLPATDRCGALIAIVNEDGKRLGLDPNMRIPGDLIVGTMIICGVAGEEFTDIPCSFQSWKSAKDIIEKNSLPF